MFLEFLYVTSIILQENTIKGDQQQTKEMEQQVFSIVV